MSDQEIYDNLLSRVREEDSNPKGITKTQLARIYGERFGTSHTTIWEYIQDLIEIGRLELKKTNKQQHTLFLTKIN